MILTATWPLYVLTTHILAGKVSSSGSHIVRGNSLAINSVSPSTFVIEYTKLSLTYSQTGCSLASNISILRCNVAILMCKLLGPNCNRVEKWLSKSYSVLKIYLQIIFVKSVYSIYKVHVGKNNQCNLIF